MSLVHDNLKREGAASGGWYVKIAEGSTYGPVGINTLREWAAQSRIAPGNRVSNDGRKWVAAESVRELKMEWSATLPNGDKYGPFNVLAVPHLFHSGALPPGAKLTNRISGKTVSVYELVKASLDEKDVAPRQAQEPAVRAPEKSSGIGPREIQAEFEILCPPDNATADAAPTAEAKSEPGARDLESRAKYLALQLEHTKREWAREKDDLAGKSSARENELSAELERLKEEAGNSEREAESLKAEIGNERRKLKEALAQARRQEEIAREEAAQLTGRIEAQSAEFEKAKAEDEKKRAELALGVGRLEALLRESSEKVKSLESESAREKERNDLAIRREREAGDELRRGLGETRRDLDAKALSLAEVSRRLAEVEKERDLVEEKLESRERELAGGAERAREEASKTAERIGKLEWELRERDEKLAELEDKKLALTLELEGAKGELERATEERESATRRLRELQDAGRSASEAERKLTEAQEQCELLKMESRGREDEASREIALARSERAKALEEIEKLRKEIAGAGEKHGRLEAQFSAVKRELDAAKLALSKALEQRSALEKQRAQENEAYASRIAELEAERKTRVKTMAPEARPVGAKRFPFLKMAATLAAAAGISVAAFVLGQKSYELRQAQIESETPESDMWSAPAWKEPAGPLPKVAQPAENVWKETPKLGTATLEKTAPAVSHPKPFAWPEIKMANVRVSQSEKTCVIVFEFGIFRSLTRLADGAEQALEQVAARLRDGVKDFDIVIEGHADLVPVSSQAAGSFADNDALAMRRAEMVRDLFRDKFHIPADRMKVVSAGVKDPPFANENETTRKKNRTVVLRLERR